MNRRTDQDIGAPRIINHLAYNYEGLFDRDRIEALFHDSYDRIAETARVTIFLPTLAEKSWRAATDSPARSTSSWSSSTSDPTRNSSSMPAR